MQDWIKTKRSADGTNVPAGSEWHLCRFNSSRMLCSVSAVNKRKPLVQGLLKNGIGLFQLSECSLIRRRFSIVSIDTFGLVSWYHLVFILTNRPDIHCQ